MVKAPVGLTDRLMGGASMITSRGVRWAWPGSVQSALAACLLVGCGSAQAPAAQAPGAQHADTTYELVLLAKTDPFDFRVKVTRKGYDACVFAANLNHANVKPFPATIPAAAYTQSMTTYLFRGHDHVIRHEPLAYLDDSKMKPDQQCEVTVRTDTRVDVDLVVGAKHTIIQTDESGHLIVQTEDISLLLSHPDPKQSTAQYTERRTMNGIGLRCLPPGSPVLDASSLQELCIYEKDGVLDDVTGKAMALAMRGKPWPGSPYVEVTEPQSLRVLEHPDPGLFDAATYTR